MEFAANATEALMPLDKIYQHWDKINYTQNPKTEDVGHPIHVAT